jgi:hypothetical protein
MPAEAKAKLEVGIKIRLTEQARWMLLSPMVIFSIAAPQATRPAEHAVSNEMHGPRKFRQYDKRPDATDNEAAVAEKAFRL